MLYSASRNIGFVHYPKTAGHSVASWFKRSFPDAIYLDPPTEHKVSHLGVIPSLSLLGARNAEILPTLSIIGVMREPVSMMSSLYKYWKAYKFAKADKELPLLIQCARIRTFVEFVNEALDEPKIEAYESFFGFEGPAWPKTRIVPYESLETSLFQVIKNIGLANNTTLERLNVGPASHGLVCNIPKDTIDKMHRYFSWYYKIGKNAMVY